MQDWGNNNPGDDIEKVIVDFTKKVKEKMQGSGGNDSFKPGRGLLLIIVIIIAAFGIMSSFYKVNTEETAVIMRFGKFNGFAEAGLHFKLPFGIDRVINVPTERVEKEEFGYRTVNPGVRTTYTKKGLEEESLTLTGDLNVSDVEWIVQYQIAEPFKFVFHIRRPIDTIRDIAEAVVRKAVGNSNVTKVLTTERAELAGEIEADLQKILNDYDIGVRIVTVKFQDVTPPGPVKAAFNEVNEAEQQKESLIFQAREQYNREVPKARGEAKKAIQEAQGYATARINQARGEADRFLSILKEYRKAPEVTRRRMYLETLEEVLPRLEEVYIMDKQSGGNILPLLPLRSEKGGNK
jgi:membrane protease subunit HflK